MNKPKRAIAPSSLVSGPDDQVCEDSHNGKGCSGGGKEFVQDIIFQIGHLQILCYMELSEGTWPKIKIYGPPGGRPNTV